MGLSRRLHPQTRHEIVGAKKNRVPLTQIAVYMSLNYNTVKYTWKQRHARGQSGKDLSHGRPRKTTDDQDRDLYKRVREMTSCIAVLTFDAQYISPEDSKDL